MESISIIYFSFSGFGPSLRERSLAAAARGEGEREPGRREEVGGAGLREEAGVEGEGGGGRRRRGWLEAAREEERGRGRKAAT